MRENKNFRGAPFGVQTARFDVSGIHPKVKKPGTFTQIPYDPKWTDDKVRNRGPGMYHPDLQGFNPLAVELRASGPGWAREQEMETLAAMPHLLHKELFEYRRELKRKVGPGSYNFKDFIQDLSEKPGSILGICEPRADRFGRIHHGSFTPGPGTYGKNGVPHTLMEEKNRRSTSTKGILDNASGSRYQLAPGCALGPGTYKFGSSIDKYINRVVSTRGPYDLFSGDRTKPISIGHFAAPKFTNLGPGHYSIKSGVEDLSEQPGQHKGKFGKVAQYPRPPAERHYISVLAQCPKEQYFPGPNVFKPSCPGEWPKVQNYKLPPFLSTAERMDRRAQKFFTGNYNSVGVGRYNIRRFEEAQFHNGHQSIFKSKGLWSVYPSEKYLKERIRGKNVPTAEKSQPPRSESLPGEKKPRQVDSFRHQITS